MKFSSIFIIFFLLFSFQSINAQNVLSGKLKDKKNEPLPFAGVFVQGTSKGTSTNVEGDYTLNLPAGNYQVTFQSIGYKSKTVSVNLSSENISLDVTLEDESVELETVVISGKEDPAYNIIRKAQSKRSYYLEEEIKGYRCKIYSKIFEEGTSNGGTISLFGATKEIQKGIFYLSETMSELNFEQPNSFQEKVLASKVSGDSAGFSYNRANWINFYRNKPLQTNSASFISPIAQNAMDYYEYELQGKSKDRDITIYKIKISPKFQNAAAFRGFIYIVDETSRIHSVDAWVDKGTAVGFDSVSIRQIYTPVTQDQKGVWLSLSLTFYFELGISSKAKGFYHTVSSDYEINPTFAPNFFGGKVYEFADKANKKEDKIWQEMRPIPLTNAEKNDYNIKNILENNTAKPAIKDSVVRAQNSNNVLNILFTTGFRYKNAFKKTNFQISPLMQVINFNTVEGLVIDPSISFSKIFAGNRTFDIKPTLRYGFSNQRFQTKLEMNYTFNPKKFGKISVEGGRYVSQYSDFAQIQPVFNTLYSLFRKENWLKLYEKTFAKADLQYELFNGFALNIGGEYAKRDTMTNTNFTSTISDNRRLFTSNIPANIAILERNYMFDSNETLLFNGQITFTPKQKYLLRPDEKISLGSNLPVFSVKYTKGMMDSDFDLLRVGVRDTWNWGIYGNGSLSLVAGQFLNDNKVYFADFQHFRGNRILAFQNGNTSFQLLNYYQFSQTKSYFQAHWSHNFAGFLTDKIGIFKTARASLVMGANYLYSDMTGNYVEAGIGINRFLRFLRVDWWHSFNEQGYLEQSAKVSFSF